LFDLVYPAVDILYDLSFRALSTQQQHKNKVGIA